MGEDDPPQSLTVPASAAGTRLDRFLAQQGLGSRTAVERLLATGLVLVDGGARPKSHRLEGGERLTLPAVAPDDGAGAGEPAMPGPGAECDPAEGLRIAFEDEHLLVVDKPAGLVVHQGVGPKRRTLVEALASHGPRGGDDPARAGVVHRLDLDTSGLLVVARTPQAFRPLARMVRERELVREYTALVRGRPRSWRGRIEAPIGRDRRDPTRQSLESDRPREAFTGFEVLELLTERALLHVTLETGRMHQIRVHLAAIGLPVCGDPVYGVAADLGLERQFLHASRLAFVHPMTGVQLEIESALPAELEAALDLARAT